MLGYGVVVYRPAEPGGVWRAVFNRGRVAAVPAVIARLAAGAPGKDRAEAVQGRVITLASAIGLDARFSRPAPGR